MSQAFNPYREWLGVASANPSPNYYELLGLSPLEADIGAINAAYQRQSSQLAARLGGVQAELAQRLMGELAEARMTLMTPTAKRAYDQALLAHRSVAPVSIPQPAGEAQGFLPPAGSSPVAVPAPAAVPSAGGYAAPQVYPASHAQPMAAQPVAPSYYVAPQAVASSPVIPVHPPASETMPVIRRRPPRRRRSSAVPALLITVLAVGGILGGFWFYYNGSRSVVVASPSDADTSAPPKPRPKEGEQKGRKVPTTEENVTKVGTAPAPAVTDAPTETPTPAPTPSPAAAPGSTGPEPVRELAPAEEDGEKASMEKAPEEPAELGSEKSPRDKTEPDKPRIKPREASPEETAAVAKALKDVRAALASRDLAKAKDLLDEATIEATARDTLAQVNRVEMLTSYVENFWDAVRKTLPKLEAAEVFEVDGKQVAIVEADETRLVVRIEGRNHDYPLRKIPAKLAYYLANRWLAVDDPVRNLVLAAFEIVDPKGDRAHAESLLDAASAARLNAEPLYAELKAARGG